MRRSAFVSPALLVALASASACHRAPPGEERAPLPREASASLESAFPSFAARVLDRARGLGPTRDDAGFHLDARGAGARARALSLIASERADAPLKLHARGLDLEVRERGSSGRAEAIEGAVVHARAGVSSFWSATEGGVEEWLKFERGVLQRGAPAASWAVSGGTLKQRGGAIEIDDATGHARVLVTAPRAFARGGAPLTVELRVHAGAIELYVDADGEEALIDPYWKSVAAMPQARYDHAAALLKNGQVFVAGGYPGTGEGNPLDDVYTYDPAGDAWTQQPSMVIERQAPTATTLLDGTVLVTGGDRYGQPIATTEVFDPTTSSWAPVPDMPNSRENTTATLLKDGHALLAGGRSGGGCGAPGVIDFCDLYDPVQEAWLPTDPMFSFRERHVAVELADGTVLAAGGSNDFAVTSLHLHESNLVFPGANIIPAAEIYDPVTGHWTTTGDLNEAREDFAGVLLADGTVLVEGGLGINGTILGSAEIFDPTLGTWKATSPLVNPRSSHTATVLKDGRVLVAGGYDANGPLASVEIYDPKTSTWADAMPMIDARSNTTATLLPSGDLLLVAGQGTNGYLDAAELYSTGCRDDNDCALTEYCTSMQCAPKKGDGATSTDPTQCLSGIIADGVCCDTACDAGVCDACTVKAGGSVDGKCGFTTAACDQPNKCADGVCKQGACSPVNKIDGTECDNGICIAGDCLADPKAITSGAGSGTTSTSNGAGGTSGTATTSSSAQGGAGGDGTGDQLTGGACAMTESGAPRDRTWLASAALAFFALIRRRRRPSQA